MSSRLGPRSCELRTVGEALDWIDQLLVDGRRVFETNWIDALRAGELDADVDDLDAALAEYDAQAALTRDEFLCRVRRLTIQPTVSREILSRRVQGE